ncbi:MAG TPA: hypothetical protein VK483_00130 [Chitinophagaceae bacterium]|nr:hypothetical protein [Chitinophagaceae bacterium]
MKRIIKQTGFLLMAALFSFQLWAQDKKLDVDINVNKKDSNWYQQPWVWIVGGAVFIIILVALLRGGGKKE